LSAATLQRPTRELNKKAELIELFKVPRDAPHAQVAGADAPEKRHTVIANCAAPTGTPTLEGVTPSVAILSWVVPGAGAGA